MNETRRFAGLVPVAILFALAALPLVRLGTGDNPALDEARRRAPLDVAIVGDSRAHVGLSPRVLQETMATEGLAGLRAYNFAADGTDLLHHFDLVDRGLLADPAKRPRVIVWAPNPLGFNDGRLNNRLQMVADMDLWALWRAGAPTELRLDLITMRWFPPYKRRPLAAEQIAMYVEIAGKKTLPLQQRILGLSYKEPPLSREYHTLPDGHEPFTVLDWQDRFERGAKAYEVDYAELGKMDWHLALAEELLARAERAGVKVVIVELPVAPWFRAHLGLDPHHLAWRKALTEAAHRHGALYWDHTARYDDDHVFGDPAHMAEPLSFSYSGALGHELARDPAVRAALGAK